MRTTATTAILTALALVAIAPAARAEIASKAYVDDSDKTIIYGSTNPASADVTAVTTAGGVKGYVDALGSRVTTTEGDIDTVEGRMNQFAGENRTMEYAVWAVANDAMNRGNHSPNNILLTDLNGMVVSSNKLSLAGLELPTPPDDCTTKGCMLMFYNGRYVWEPVSRDTNETPPTNGSIVPNTRLSGSSSTVTPSRSVSNVCDQGEVEYDGTTCGVVEQIEI